MNNNPPDRPSEAQARQAIERTAQRLRGAGLTSEEAITAARETARRRDRERGR